jgi:hypothetical protein
MKLLIRSFFLLTILAYLSCEKSLLGEGLLSEDDKIRGTFTDTVKVVTETATDPFLRSDRILQNLLGSMNDPIFGKTSAGMVVEFGLPIIGFPDTIGGYQFDSVVLNLQLTGYYGDTTIPQSFIVYKVLEPFDKKQTYFSNLNPNIDMVEVGRIDNVLFKPNSKTIINGQPSDVKRLRIKLSDSFGTSLVDKLKTDDLSSNEKFEKFLPGLYVVPDTTSFGGCIASFNLNTLVSNMSLYYKNSNGNNLLSAFTSFITGFNISTYRHNYSGTPVLNTLNNPELAKEISYVQGASGVKTKVTFPHLSSLKNKGILKAEIEVTEIYDNSRNTFLPLSRILAVRVDGASSVNLRDYTFFGENHFNGFGIDTVDLDGNKIRKYKINITDYFKNLLLDKFVNDGIFITSYIAQEKSGGEVNSNIYTPARTIIGGSNHPEESYRLKLLLRYTDLNE